MLRNEKSEKFYIFFFNVFNKENNVLILIFNQDNYYIKYVLKDIISNEIFDNIKIELVSIHEDDSYVFIDSINKFIYNLGYITNCKITTTKTNQYYFYSYDQHIYYLDNKWTFYESHLKKSNMISDDLTNLQQFSLIKILKSEYKSILYENLTNIMLKDNNITNNLNKINWPDQQSYDFKLLTTIPDSKDLNNIKAKYLELLTIWNKGNIYPYMLDQYENYGVDYFKKFDDGKLFIRQYFPTIKFNNSSDSLPIIIVQELYSSDELKKKLNKINKNTKKYIRLISENRKKNT